MLSSFIIAYESESEPKKNLLKFSSRKSMGAFDSLFAVILFADSSVSISHCIAAVEDLPSFRIREFGTEFFRLHGKPQSFGAVFTTYFGVREAKS